jgi:hypothetical protein
MSDVVLGQASKGVKGSEKLGFFRGKDKKTRNEATVKLTKCNFFKSLNSGTLMKRFKPERNIAVC